MSSRIDFIDLHLKMSIKEEKTTAITNEAITTIRSPAPVAPLQHSRAYALQCCSCLRITPYRCDICDDSVCEICWHEHLEEDFHLCPWCYLPELRQPTVTSTTPHQDIAAAALQMSGTETLQCCSCLRVTPFSCDICDDSVCEICWHEDLEDGNLHLCPWCYLRELRRLRA